MKAYLAIALVALLFNFGTTASVGKTHLKPSSTEEVVVQEVADSNESLDDNVVDNDNSVLSNNVNDETVSSPVNLENVHNVPVHNVPEVTVVQNAPTKTLTHHVKPVVSTVNTVPVSTVNTVPVQNVVKTQVPRNNVVNVVKSVQAPQTQVVYSQVPQTQVVYSVVPQQQHQVSQWQQPQTQVVYSVPQQQSVNVAPQQSVYSVPQQQSVNVVPQQSVYSVPQQQTVQQWQQPQQVVYTVPQQVVSVPQQQTVQTVQQWQQPQQWAQPQWQVVKNNVQPQVVRKNVVLEQTRPVQYATKTVVNKVVPNPIVYQVSPSKTVANRQWQPSQQTVLTGAQLVSNVADESAKTDVIVQEVEQ